MATHRFKIEGKDFEVKVGTRTGSQVGVTVNGKSYAVEVESQSGAVVPQATAAAAPPPVAAPTPAAAPAGGGGDGVHAPISGVVLNVSVKPGDKVEPQTQVLVLEAMKMENEIFAAVSGTVTEVHVQAQQEVREGDLLVSIKPA